MTNPPISPPTVTSGATIYYLTLLHEAQRLSLQAGTSLHRNICQVEPTCTHSPLDQGRYNTHLFLPVFTYEVQRQLYKDSFDLLPMQVLEEGSFHLVSSMSAQVDGKMRVASPTFLTFSFYVDKC